MTSVKSDKEKLFKALLKSYKDAYPDKKNQLVQKNVVEIWNSIKKGENVAENVNKKIQELNVVAQQKKSKMMSFWSKVSIYY